MKNCYDCKNFFGKRKDGEYHCYTKHKIGNDEWVGDKIVFEPEITLCEDFKEDAEWATWLTGETEWMQEN